MKTLTILFVCTAFMFAGCFPQSVVLWSPDGQHGAVMTKDKIYFCGPAGKLSEQSLATEGPAAWAPNANDFYYVSRISLDSWEKAKKYLTAAEQVRLIAQAKDALAKLKPGDMKDEKKNPFAKFDTADIILMLLYLKDNHAAELKAKLDPQQQKDFLNNKIASNLYQLNVITNCDFAKPQLILQTFREIGGELRPSPNGKAIAFVGNDKSSIYICSMNGKLTLVTENAAIFPDWTPDGNSLVYSSFTSKNGNSSELKLGSIKRVKIFNEQGEIPKNFPVAEELAGVPFHETCQIRCMKNGWIIFSSAELKLPTTKKGMPRSQSIFAIIPELPSAVINIIPQDVLSDIGDMEWDAFQLSPDQKRLAVLKNDNVIVFDFATATVNRFPVTLQNIENFKPTWQNSDTLCLLSSVQDDSGKMDVKVLLQSGNTKKIISESWPKTVMDSIIEKYRKNKEKSQPTATQPANATTKPAKK